MPEPPESTSDEMPKRKASDNAQHYLKYFDRSDIRKQVDIQAETTLKWLRTYSEGYWFDLKGKDFDLRDTRCQKPWFSVPNYTQEPVLFESRHRMLRDRAYEHGILHFLFGLEDDGIIEPINDRTWDKILSASTVVLLNQLMTYRYLKSKDRLDTVSLESLKLLYGHGRSTNRSKIREQLVNPLLPFGFFRARENKGWAISIGYVVETFWTRVYITIVNETPINPKE
jgi:hypothetical protein